MRLPQLNFKVLNVEVPVQNRKVSSDKIPIPGIDISQFPGQAQLKGCVAATPSGHADGLLLALFVFPRFIDYPS